MLYCLGIYIGAVAGALLVVASVWLSAVYVSCKG
jgi:hypothetical protein